MLVEAAGIEPQSALDAKKHTPVRRGLTFRGFSGNKTMPTRVICAAANDETSRREVSNRLVEAAGIEPASASPPLRALHAYPAIDLTPDYPTGREDPEPVQ